MAQRDLHNISKYYVALDMQSITTNTTTVGKIIDTNGYEGVEFSIQSGTDLDATTVFTPVLEDGDNSSLTDAAVVDLEFVIGTTNVTGVRPDYGTLTSGTVTPSTTPIADATFTTTADCSKVKRIGYVGRKRYVRLSIVTTAKTSGGTMGAQCVLGYPHVVPTPKDL
jgi:hypothetical protein